MKWRLFLWAVPLIGLAIAGCPNTTNPGDTNTNTDDNTDTTDTTDTTDDTTTGSVADQALSFGGSLSGLIDTLSSTLGSSSGSARKSTTALDSNASCWLEDLNGDRLVDADGNEYPEFEPGTDGTFVVDGLPVGADIMLVVDTDGDGSPDLVCFINIPAGEDGVTGELGDVVCDPLSTLVVYKLLALIAGLGDVNPDEIGIGMAALIGRIRDAFENLYDDSGVEQEISLDDIFGLSPEELAALFDALIPDGARRGMDMCEGNIRLAQATDVPGVVKAAAQILLQGGFPIADNVGGVDLSFLGDLPQVVSLNFSEFHALGQQGEQDNGAAFDDPNAPQIYMSKLAEADRNFANNDEFARHGPRGPVFSEHILARMAELFLDQRTISMDDLYRVVVDLETGMGARYTYPRWNGRDLPPTNVFESQDGTGLEINLDALFGSINDLGLNSPNPATFADRQANLRALMLEVFGDTAEPSFEQLFDGILTPRIESFEQFARQIRNARAHLPFSRSGPSEFFVLGTADQFQSDDAAPVTVNADFNADGEIEMVTIDPTGNGRFFVSFGPRTEFGMETTLLNRSNGRPLFNAFGESQRLEITDGTIFQAVGDESFLEAFSESGSFYPGQPALRVPNPEFDPTLPPDAETNPPSFEAFVLVTNPGPDGVPIRVNFAEGVCTAAENGAFYLMFNELTQAEGVFSLIDDAGALQLNDPTDPTSRVLINAGEVGGATIVPVTFTNIFGVGVPNPGYDPAGAPFYDDINGNHVRDAGEPTFDHRPFLNHPDDWRSTRIEAYYRRADNGAGFRQDQVNFAALTPQLLDGTPLIERNLRPNLNAFRFGNPNVTLNLMSAFNPPEFFNGTTALDDDTQLNVFSALALLNLVFNSVHNVEAVVDFDGPGPQPAHAELIDARLFTVPIGDPLQLVVAGFEDAAESAAASDATTASPTR